MCNNFIDCALVALAFVFCCKSKQESASRHQAVEQMREGEVFSDKRGLSGERLERSLEGASSSRLPAHAPSPLSSEKRAEPSRNLLIPFYSGEGMDAEGRTFEDILSFSDSRLESVHNYIQWLFPLSTPSVHNRNAPLLNRELIESMQGSPAIKENILRAFNRMLRFYGLRLESSGSVERADNWEERKRCWVTPHNHNYLRITRILAFMKIMNFHEEVEAFQDQLLTIYTENKHVIGKSTYKFWSHKKT